VTIGPPRGRRPSRSRTSRSTRSTSLEELAYPFHDHTITVTRCGRICFKRRKVNLSHAFAGQNVGVAQVGERSGLVTFMHYDLGYFDDQTCRLERIDNPFGPKVLPMSRNELLPVCPEWTWEGWLPGLGSNQRLPD